MTVRAVLILLMLCWYLGNSDVVLGWQIAPIEFELKFEERALRVTASFPAIGENALEFRASQWAGVKNFQDNVYLFQATDGDGRSLPNSYRPEGIWRVETGQKPFTLSYLIVHQKPTFMVGRYGQFQPTLFSKWAFLWGDSYVLEPTDPRLRNHPVRISIDPGPLKHAWFSRKLDTPLEGFDWFADSLLIAGDYRVSKIELDETNVQIAIQGEWVFSDKKITEVIESIVRAQARYMGTPPKEDLLIALVPGSPNSRGGTVVGGAIGLYPSIEDDLTKDGSHTLHLVAHEHFHLWIGQILKPVSSDQGNLYKWFHEGCTDYYASQTLFRESRLSESKLIDELNEQIVNLAQNPYASTADSVSIAENYWKNKDYNRLPYIKGGLASLLIDLKIRKSTHGKKSIDDFVRGLIAATRARGSNYDQRMMVDVLNRLDPESEATAWGQFITRYAAGTDSLPIEEVLRENEIETDNRSVPLYDLGFFVDHEQIRLGSEITKVDEGSAAEKAGLRVGDIISGMSVYHGNTEKPCVIKVKRNGSEQDIQFVPVRSQSIIQIVNSIHNQERVRRLLK